MWESRRRKWTRSHKNLSLKSLVMPVLRELAHAVAKPLSIILEKSWQSGKVSTYWKRRNLFLKRKTRKTQGATGQSSHLKVRAWISNHEVPVVRLLEYKQILWSCEPCSSGKVSGCVWECWNTVSPWFCFDQGLCDFLHINFIALVFGMMGTCPVKCL